MTREEYIKKVVEVIEGSEDFLDERLDDTVHDLKGIEAANINNDGLLSQINYICDGWDISDIKQFVNDVFSLEIDDK